MVFDIVYVTSGRKQRLLVHLKTINVQVLPWFVFIQGVLRQQYGYRWDISVDTKPVKNRNHAGIWCVFKMSQSFNLVFVSVFKPFLKQKSQHEFMTVKKNRNYFKD